MQRVVIDTNVYIDWLNRGKYEAVLFQPGAVKHLSSIVMMELQKELQSLMENKPR